MNSTEGGGGGGNGNPQNLDALGTAVLSAGTVLGLYAFTVLLRWMREECKVRSVTVAVTPTVEC